MPSNTFNFLRKDSVVVPSGSFNKRMTFLDEVTTTDDIGTPILSYVPAFTSWVHIEPWKGREYVQDNQVFAMLWVRVLLRYRASQVVNGSMHGQYGIRIYKVRAVWLPAEANKIVELLCEEIQSKGSAH